MEAQNIDSQAAHLLADARDLCPSAFRSPPAPLKIGIHTGLRELLEGEVDPEVIEVALSIWTGWSEYKKALVVDDAGTGGWPWSASMPHLEPAFIAIWERVAPEVIYRYAKGATRHATTKLVVVDGAYRRSPAPWWCW
jgi:hypothetical protein